jgi:hypothetical protein
MLTGGNADERTMFETMLSRLRFPIPECRDQQATEPDMAVRWPSTRLRSGDLQAQQRRRTLLQQAQAVPGDRTPLRQDRPVLSAMIDLATISLWL